MKRVRPSAITNILKSGPSIWDNSDVRVGVCYKVYEKTLLDAIPAVKIKFE